MRRSTWSLTARPIARGFMPGVDSPGATNSKIPTRSSTLFSIGVPVSAQLRPRGIDRTTWLVMFDSILDPLRLVEDHQVVVVRLGSQIQRRRRGRRIRSWRSRPGSRELLPQPLPSLGAAFDDGHAAVPAPTGRTPAASWSPTAWGTPTASAGALPWWASRRDGGDGLHRLAESHFVGQHGLMPRIKERHAVELKRKGRYAGNRSDSAASSDSSGGSSNIRSRSASFTTSRGGRIRVRPLRPAALGAATGAVAPGSPARSSLKHATDGFDSRPGKRHRENAIEFDGQVAPSSRTGHRRRRTPRLRTATSRRLPDSTC